MFEKQAIIRGGWSSCDRRVIEIQGPTLPKDGGMTLDQLQIFIAVAEREHVTRAANALGLAPPSVSAAVASLEREFGTKLFHRVGRGIVLTEGGKLLLDEARDLVNRDEAVKLAMRESTGLSRGGRAIKATHAI